LRLAETGGAWHAERNSVKMQQKKIANKLKAKDKKPAKERG
jgi:hypothetical protein